MTRTRNPLLSREHRSLSPFVLVTALAVMLVPAPVVTAGNESSGGHP
ncbi:hypothetical protein [Actinopolyspora mortivallis]|nr:hypothetical protein [Actinopolyspora mortivallis]